MHRIDGPGNVVVSPGIRRFINQSLPGTPGTIFVDVWANAVQEEIAGVIEAAGLTLAPSGSDDQTSGWGQLAQALFASAAIPSAGIQDLDLTKVFGTLSIDGTTNPARNWTESADNGSVRRDGPLTGAHTKSERTYEKTEISLANSGGTVISRSRQDALQSRVEAVETGRTRFSDMTSTLIRVSDVKTTTTAHNRSISINVSGATLTRTLGPTETKSAAFNVDTIGVSANDTTTGDSHSSGIVPKGLDITKTTGGVTRVAKYQDDGISFGTDGQKMGFTVLDISNTSPDVIEAWSYPGSGDNYDARFDCDILKTKKIFSAEVVMQSSSVASGVYEAGAYTFFKGGSGVLENARSIDFLPRASKNTYEILILSPRNYSGVVAGPVAPEALASLRLVVWHEI